MVLLRTWQCCMAETVKRKSRKSSSTSSTDDNLSPDGKKLRLDSSLSDSELCESDEVLTILNMAGEVIPKLEQVLEKLENLERYVKAVDEKVSNLQAKVDCFEAFKNKTEKKIKELEDGLDFANTERESFKEKFDKLKCEINQLREQDLIDTWRLRNPTEKRFTWRQKTPIIQRRLDYWLVNNSLQDDIVSVDIITSIKSDHSAITSSINSIDDGKRGPSFWTAALIRVNTVRIAMVLSSALK